MAFRIVQTFDFKNVEYTYDRMGDVLYVSFGSPAPAIAIQVEDWLALRMSFQPPFLAGMTIIGFKRIFEKLSRYIEKELPERIERLKKVSVSVSYNDETDTLIMRLDEPLPVFERIKGFFGYTKPRASIFEPLATNVYVEKNLPSKDIAGIKFLEFTKCGPAAVEAFWGVVIDAVFEPQPQDENAHLVATTIVRYIDQKKLAALTAL